MARPDSYFDGLGRLAAALRACCTAKDEPMVDESLHLMAQFVREHDAAYVRPFPAGGAIRPGVEFLSVTLPPVMFLYGQPLTPGLEEALRPYGDQGWSVCHIDTTVATQAIYVFMQRPKL